VDGDLHPVPQAKLGEDADDVALDGGLAEVEPGGEHGEQAGRRQLVGKAGFTQVRYVEMDNPFNRLYELSR